MCQAGCWADLAALKQRQKAGPHAAEGQHLRLKAHLQHLHVCVLARPVNVIRPVHATVE